MEDPFSKNEPVSPEGQEIDGEKAPDQELLKGIIEGREKKIEAIGQCDFSDQELDYSEEEQAKILELQKEFEGMVGASGDDSGKFLEMVTKMGVGVVEKSRFLKNRTQNIKGFISRASGAQEGINAAYLTPEAIKTLFETEGQDGRYLDELENGQGENGLILLYKKPNPKSVFHEGFHALQYMRGFDMKPKDEEQHAKRELETSVAVIKAKEAGLLKEVERVKPDKIVKGHFGKVPIFGPNDVEKEATQFFENSGKVKVKVVERKEQQAMAQARDEIDNAFKASS